MLVIGNPRTTRPCKLATLYPRLARPEKHVLLEAITTEPTHHLSLQLDHPATMARRGSR
jgi:hypothetical protein